jgi:3-deoxy-D-manno-octulosonic acid (KDO) 8-phosphate synthase
MALASRNFFTSHSEAHTCPRQALSDGLQSLTIPQFEAMVRGLRPYIELWRGTRAAEMAAASAPASE